MLYSEKDISINTHNLSLKIFNIVINDFYAKKAARCNSAPNVLSVCTMETYRSVFLPVLSPFLPVPPTSFPLVLPLMTHQCAPLSFFLFYQILRPVVLAVQLKLTINLCITAANFVDITST